MKREHFTTRDLILIALMAAIIAILSPFKIPLIFTPISLTLGVFAVLLCGYVLEPVHAMLAVVIYLLLGLVGLPVFSGFHAGFGAFAGPTGGYLIGYLPLCFFTSYFCRKYSSPVPQLAGMLLGLIVLYALGTAWFSYSRSIGFGEALFMAVIPFIPFDLAKIALAFWVGSAVKERLKDVVWVRA